MSGDLDGDETDTDCGGSCAPCETGKACKVAKDCQSSICINKICAAPACGDMVKNGNESDVDCGGSCPERCALGQKCNDGPDCQTLTCINGVCGKSPCTNGFKDAMETDVDCGGPICDKCADGKACSDGADCGGGTCVNQFCRTPCLVGRADCDGSVVNGCEIDVTTDVKNCGTCGSTCPSLAHATTSCIIGSCAIGACDAGFGDCDRRSETGCEVDLTETLAHCGACGKVCGAPPNASAGCKGGVCGIGACSPLFGDCDGDPVNGCEKDLTADVANCGRCQGACGLPNAKNLCAAGQCGILACNPGYADCDVKAPNGCEVSLASDAKNCGGCGNVCPKNSPSCVNGSCTIRVLICAAFGGDLKALGASLNNQNQFTFDVLDGRINTPSLQTLKDYNAVFLFSFVPWADRTTLGNNLADYVDGGGGVVSAMDNFNTFEQLGGRWSINYECVKADNSFWIAPGSLKVSPNDPNSPLVNGVTTLTNFRYGKGLLAPGSVSVWDSTQTASPVIITCAPGGHKRVDLNFEPWPGAWSGDGYVIIRNALGYVMAN